MSSGRINLVTRFICSECGSHLSMSYDSAKPRESMIDGGMVEDMLSNTHKLEQFVSIDPCEICIEKYKKPLEDMKKVLSLITETK